MKHFVCKKCGNLVAMINDAGKILSCCKNDMDEVTPNVTEASREKHTPTIKRKGNTVEVIVGDKIVHPMEPEHFISWVCLITDSGSQRKMISEKKEPRVVFHISDGEKVIKAFAFCNLHGLWSRECIECAECE